MTALKNHSTDVWRQANYAETGQTAARIGKADEPNAVTLREFARMYVELRGDLAPATLVEQARTLRYLKEHLGEEKIVSRITPLDGRRFIAWLRNRQHRGRKPAAATVNKAVRECRRIFREAIVCSLLRENPFAGIRQEKVGQKPWHHVTAAEYRRMTEVTGSLRWRGMISLGYCCGLRLGEVLNLTWGDVDFEQNRIRVVRKGASSSRHEWCPKDRDGRIVPLPEETATLLANVQRNRRG